jgi:hypothetical protein
MDVSETLKDNYLIVREQTFEKKYNELLNYCQAIAGFFRTDDVSLYLGKLNPTEYADSNLVISGFYASLQLFSDNIEMLFSELQTELKQFNPVNNN